MKPRQLLVYALVFLALGLFYWFYEVELSQKETALKEAQARIFELKPDQVTALRYTSAGTDFHLVREDSDEWRLKSPLETPADRWAVDRLLDQALEGEKERVFAEPVEDLAEFGLDKPSLSLTLLAGERALGPTLQVGNKSPAGAWYYARLGQSKEVFTVSARLYQDLNKSLYDLRDKTLVFLAEEKVDRLVIRGEEETELEKKGPDRWEFVRPQPGRADAEEVKKILSRGLKGRVKEFVAEPKSEAEYGLDQPRVKVRALGQGEVVAEVTVGGPKKEPAPAGTGEAEPEIEGYWARTSQRPEVMLISPEVAEILDRSPAELEERHVFVGLERSKAQELEVTNQDRRLTARKVKEIWEVTHPAGAQSQDYQIESFLMDLEDLKYVRTEEPTPESLKKYGLNQPEVKIKLTGPKEVLAQMSLSLQPPDEDHLAAHPAGGPVVLIPGDFARKLPAEVRPPAPGAAEEEKKEDRGGA